MFAKNEPGTDPGASLPHRSRTASAVDVIAAASGALIVGLGLSQLLSPTFTSPMTGIESGTGAEILGLQWSALGALLMIGGVIRTRVVSIFAAEFILISGLAALAVTLFKDHGVNALLLHGAVSFLGLVSSGFARLTDKADLKRELRLVRERVNLDRRPQANAEGERHDA